MSDAAAVADDDTGPCGMDLQMLVQGHLHVVELDLHAIEQGIVVGGARGDAVQGVDHLDDAVQDALGQHQAQVAGRRAEGGA